MSLVIITGMSGAGKSRVMITMEDIGYYCIDNMPPKLLPQFVEICRQAEHTRVAIAIDVRGGKWFDDLPEALEKLRVGGIPYQILFLDCNDIVLANRYKETRRKHPLTLGKRITTAEAIQSERKLLEPIAREADFRIDTSLLSIGQLRDYVVDLFLQSPKSSMTVQCMSFGFKYGYPAESDLVFDMRCLPNPFYVDELKFKTGLDKEVQDYVMDKPHSVGLEKRLTDLIDYLLPLYQQEGKTQLVIAFGCTGGKHRSVTFAERIAQHIQKQDYDVMIRHRDITKV